MSKETAIHIVTEGLAVAFQYEGQKALKGTTVMVPKEVLEDFQRMMCAAPGHTIRGVQVKVLPGAYRDRDISFVVDGHEATYFKKKDKWYRVAKRFQQQLSEYSQSYE